MISAPPPLPDTTTWSDWGLSAISGTVGALVGFVGLYLVFLLTRKNDHEKQARIERAEEDRRVLSSRVDAVVALVERLRDIATEWNAEDAKDLATWSRTVKRPILVEFEMFGVRVLVDAPEVSALVRGEAAKGATFRADKPGDATDFNERTDALYEWLLRWVADPTILEERPTFF